MREKTERERIMEQGQAKWPNICRACDHDQDKPKEQGKLKCEGCFFCQSIQSDILELFCAHPYCTGRVAVKTKHSPLRYVSGREGAEHCPFFKDNPTR